MPGMNDCMEARYAIRLPGWDLTARWVLRVEAADPLDVVGALAPWTDEIRERGGDVDLVGLR